MSHFAYRPNIVQMHGFYPTWPQQGFNLAQFRPNLDLGSAFLQSGRHGWSNTTSSKHAFSLIFHHIFVWSFCLWLYAPGCSSFFSFRLLLLSPPHATHPHTKNPPRLLIKPPCKLLNPSLKPIKERAMMRVLFEFPNPRPLRLRSLLAIFCNFTNFSATESASE